MYKRTNEDGRQGFGILTEKQVKELNLTNIPKTEITETELLELYKKAGYDASELVKKYLSTNTKK